MRRPPSADGDGDGSVTESTRHVTMVGDVMVLAAGSDDFVDPTLRPNLARLRERIGSHRYDPGLVARARMVRADDGAPLAPLRTFSGNLAHENGLAASRKSRRTLGWQGETQYEMIVKAQTMHDVVQVGTETVRFEYVDGNVARKYTVDIEFVGSGGGRRLLELKRDRSDLADPDYCRTLAIVAEICRCCAIGFDVVFSHEVYGSITHRRQAAEFAARAFVPFDDGHRSALKRHAESTGGRSTVSALGRVLCDGDGRWAMALIQAMTVARLVEIDLSRRLRPDTHVILHPENLLP